MAEFKKVIKDEKDRDKNSSAKTRKMAEKPHGYQLTKEDISGEGTGSCGEVHGIREVTREYGPSEGTPQEGKDSTRPLESTSFCGTEKLNS
jgi:hypothetical protein